MPKTLTMPKLSPTMTNGILAHWHKAIGDEIAPGDVLIDIVTDKATIEYSAADPGFLRQILLEEGKSALVGEPIAILTSTKNEAIEGYVPEGVALEGPKVEYMEIPSPTLTQKKTTRTFASPLAKKMASSLNIPLEGIAGSGPGGRIMSRDLELTMAQKTSAPKAPTYSIPSNMTLTPLTQLRTAIGNNLQYAKSHIPHFYVSITIEASRLVSFREKLKAANLNVTVNDILIMATGKALMLHPAIRASFYPAQQAVGTHKNADIAVAVSVPGGLFTPIIKEAQNKSLLEISKEMKGLSAKAKEGTLLPEEYQGGAITITNLGMFGVDQFLPILNAPQVAIIAVSAIADRPVMCEGKVVPGKNFCLTVAADHRAVDGTDVAAFLKTMKELLEEMNESSFVHL
jgi:pyruvate dehydrogenase E2 component (dihydrolipoamide acetyltransferase)